jgi:ATP-dependent RNA helicase RhlE
MALTDFNLLPELIKGLEAMGFSDYTPIQKQAIPHALEGKDVLGSAQTGSGKTVAFVLPMLDKLLRARVEGSKPAVRAVVLVPTRELAAQVETAVRDVARFTPVKCALVIGGTSFHQQVQALRAGAEVVVATPGRLLDHYRQGTIYFKDVKVTVLDEADRMLDMGFMPDIRRIMSSLPKERHTMMFSATIPSEVERVVNEFMKTPFRVEIDRPNNPAAGIAQMLYPVGADQKLELLLTILKNTQITSAVIFTRTKSRADRVSTFLEARGIAVAVLHSNKTQAQRTRAMDNFREKTQLILVATDIAARGIDVRHISHVINFDVPEHPEDYVHRIGRTGRAFTVGDAYTLMDREEEKWVIAIEQFIGTTIPRAVFPDFPYKVPPLLKAYKPPVSSQFRLRRTIPRSSGMRFKRR